MPELRSSGRTTNPGLSRLRRAAIRRNSSIAPPRRIGRRGSGLAIERPPYTVIPLTQNEDDPPAVCRPWRGAMSAKTDNRKSPRSRGAYRWKQMRLG